MYILPLFVTLITLTTSKFFHHSKIYIGADHNLDAIFLNENNFPIYTLPDKSKWKKVKEIDIVLFEGDELRFVISDGIVNNNGRVQGTTSKKTGFSFGRFIPNFGIFVQKEKKSILEFLNKNRGEENNYEEIDAENPVGFAVTIDYYSQKGGHKILNTNEDWICNDGDTILKERIGNSTNYDAWKGKISDDAYVIWANGNPSVSTCVYVIPDIDSED